MQLRRSLIELEDQNVQNSIEVLYLYLCVLKSILARTHGQLYANGVVVRSRGLCTMEGRIDVAPPIAPVLLAHMKHCTCLISYQ